MPTYTVSEEQPRLKVKFVKSYEQMLDIDFEIEDIIRKSDEIKKEIQDLQVRIVRLHDIKSDTGKQFDIPKTLKLKE